MNEKAKLFLLTLHDTVHSRGWSRTRWRPSDPLPGDGPSSPWELGTGFLDQRHAYTLSDLFPRCFYAVQISIVNMAGDIESMFF